MNEKYDSGFDRAYFDSMIRGLVSDMAAKKGAPMRVFINTFGCQQNEADSEKLMGMAISYGYEKTADIEKADLIIYNTCAVREHAELRALSRTGLLKKLKENNRDILIGLWGCMVSQQHRIDDIKYRYPYVSFVAGTNMLGRFSEILCDCLVHKRRRYYVDPDDVTITEGLCTERENDIKAYVSIMYGCNNFCSYCVVPYVRGRERSRSPKEILREVEELVNKGYKEITLLGQNVNSYGEGLCEAEKTTFAGLLSKICKIDGDFIIRFMTSHPKDVSDELISVIAENPKIERHFHLPMQAGSDRILSLMNRKYDSAKYLETAEKLRKSVPDIAITSDIIVGFPDETEEDFCKTLEMVEKIGFDAIFSFIFSPRKGTLAEKMPDPVSHEEKTERFSRLIALQSDISRKICEKYLGKTIRVLCDTKEKNADGYFTARNSQNHEILIRANEAHYGEFVSVRVVEIKNMQIIAEYGEEND